MAEFDLSLFTKPPTLLPIARHKRSLQYTVENSPVTIIIGQTGSGKTTQIPQFLNESGWTNGGKIIGVTQPRRVAATSVANRVAEEMRCNVGEEVGYSIRFEDVTSAKTKIKFLTDGMLLREALIDPLLSRYSVIMVDEAHERSLSSDILLGLLKKIMKKRQELKLIVSSATLEAERLAEYFQSENNSRSNCKILNIEGRTFPVDIHYLDAPTEDYVLKAVETSISIHANEPPGDVLVFLTGRSEIEKAMEMLSTYAEKILPTQQALQPLSLYAGLSSADQMYVFSAAAENTRKVILSTNVAEASVTIEGIVYVIDCGFVKLRAYQPTTNIETLTAVPTSQASATQRAGRAGRTRAGKCYRLYTHASFVDLPQATVPEIQRTNLTPVILQMKALGIDNVVSFPYLTPPPSKLLARGLEMLYALGAVDDYARLTSPLGTRMAELALQPMMSKALLASTTPQFECLPEMLTIAAMTSLQSAGTMNVWFHHEGEQKAMDLARRKFAAEEGDHLTYLNVYQAFVGQGKKDSRWCQQNYLNHKAMSKAFSIRSQLKRYLERLGIDVTESFSRSTGEPLSDPEIRTQKSKKILQCLASGYFPNAARMNVSDGTYVPVLTRGKTALKLYAHPTSLMFNRKADYVVFNELLETGDKIYIKDLTKVEKQWLIDFSSGYYEVS